MMNERRLIFRLQVKRLLPELITRRYLILIQLVCLFTTVLSSANSNLSVVIKPCRGRVAGDSCEIVCSVSKLGSMISFSHPPGIPMGGCFPDGSCESAYDHVLRLDVKAKQAHLTIQSLDPKKHSGQWLCALGAAESSPKELKVYVAPTDERPTIYIPAMEGEPLTLNCDVNAHNQEYAISWFQNGNKLPTNTNFDGGVYGNPSLTIHYLYANMSGNYQCSLTVPPESRNIRNGSKLNVYILESREENHTTKDSSQIPSTTIQTFLTSKEESNIVARISLTIMALMLFVKNGIQIFFVIKRNSPRVMKKQYLQIIDLHHSPDKAFALFVLLLVVLDVILYGSLYYVRSQQNKKRMQVQKDTEPELDEALQETTNVFEM